MEFEFGGVADGVEDAEKEIGGDVFGVAVHDGGDTGARGTSEAGDLSVGQALAANDVDDFGVEIAAQGDFGAVGGSEAQGLGEFGGSARDGEFRLLHGAALAAGRKIAGFTALMSHIWDIRSRGKTDGEEVQGRITGLKTGHYNE